VGARGVTGKEGRESATGERSNGASGTGAPSRQPLLGGCAAAGRGRVSGAAGLRRWARRLGLAGLYLFSFFSLSSVAGAYLGLLLLCIGFLLSVRDWYRLWREPVVLCALGFAAFVLLHSWHAADTARGLGALQNLKESAADWIKLLLFLPFAYWARGDAQRLARLLGLWLTGFVLGILLHWDWAYFGGSSSRRFGTYLPAIAFGMFTGLAAIGLVVLRRRCWSGSGAAEREGHKPIWSTGLRVALWGVLLAFMVQGLVQSFSRGSWLAFAAGLTVAVWGELRARGTARASTGRRPWLPLAVALAVVAAVLALNAPRLYERAGEEAEVLRGVLEQGQLDRGEVTSIGLRLHVWRFGLDAWQQRPWLGWGAGLGHPLIAQSQRGELRMHDGRWMVHLHNTYLEVLLQFGVLGLGLLGCWIWLLSRDFAVSYRAGCVPADLYRMFAALGVLVLVWSLFNYRVVHHDWRFFWILVAGAVYGFHLRMVLGTEKEAPSRDG
jgi:O-antigen ligase